MVYTFQAKAFVQSGVYGNNQFLCIKSHATKNRHNIFLTQPTKFLFCLIEMETNWIYSSPLHSCFLRSHAMLLPSSSHLWGGLLGDGTKVCVEGQTYVSRSLKYRSDYLVSRRRGRVKYMKQRLFFFFLRHFSSKAQRIFFSFLTMLHTCLANKYSCCGKTSEHVTLQTTVKHMHRNKDKSYSCQNHHFPAQHCLTKVELQFVNACS